MLSLAEETEFPKPQRISFFEEKKPSRSSKKLQLERKVLGVKRITIGKRFLGVKRTTKLSASRKLFFLSVKHSVTY